jgi:hypothetical protein
MLHKKVWFHNKHETYHNATRRITRDKKNYTKQVRNTKQP